MHDSMSHQSIIRDDWRRVSQQGRPVISKAIRALIRDRWRSHPTWDSPRINERHLGRRLSAYVSYYHRLRIHLTLNMDCPVTRAVEPLKGDQVRAVPEVGDLHHHYERSAA
jgi:hypothetical protein